VDPDGAHSLIVSPPPQQRDDLRDAADGDHVVEETLMSIVFESSMARPPSGSASASTSRGSRDGQGAGDHGCPFTGFRRSSFTTRQLMRLLLLRSDALNARLGYGRWVVDVGGAGSHPW
jgi:hypothetical protein